MKHRKGPLSSLYKSTNENSVPILKEKLIFTERNSFQTTHSDSVNLCDNYKCDTYRKYCQQPVPRDLHHYCNFFSSQLMNKFTLLRKLYLSHMAQSFKSATLSKHSTMHGFTSRQIRLNTTWKTNHSPTLKWRCQSELVLQIGFQKLLRCPS